MLVTIFPIFAVNVALNSIFQPAKTVCQKKFSFSRYSSLKVRFGPKNAKMGSKESPISRKRQMLSKIWFDIRNLRKILFQVRMIRFLPTCRLQGEKWPEDCLFSFLSPFWMVSGHFLDNYLKDFDQTCWEVRQNGYKAGAKDQTVKFWAIGEIFRLKDG